MALRNFTYGEVRLVQPRCPCGGKWCEEEDAVWFVKTIADWADTEELPTPGIAESEGTYYIEVMHVVRYLRHALKPTLANVIARN